MQEAAELLGVKSHEALAPIMRGNDVPIEWRDDRPLVALSDVERVAGSPWIQRMRELDRLHDLSGDLGREMTREEMDALEAGRPGHVPWRQRHDRAEKLA